VAHVGGKGVEIDAEDMITSMHTCVHTKTHTDAHSVQHPVCSVGRHQATLMLLLKHTLLFCVCFQAAGGGVGSVTLGGREAAEEDPALGMNKSQVAGVVTALSHRVSLLQGPPGTGECTTSCQLQREIDPIRLCTR
jgi:hypothetical protein